jgi:hypothetical protein
MIILVPISNARRSKSHSASRRQALMRGLNLHSRGYCVPKRKRLNEFWAETALRAGGEKIPQWGEEWVGRSGKGDAIREIRDWKIDATNECGRCSASLRERVSEGSGGARQDSASTGATSLPSRRCRCRGRWGKEARLLK